MTACQALVQSQFLSILFNQSEHLFASFGIEVFFFFCQQVLLLISDVKNSLEGCKINKPFSGLLVYISDDNALGREIVLKLCFIIYLTVNELG